MKTKNAISEIKEVLQAAHTLAGDGVNFPERLKAIDLPDSAIEVRDVREVSKVANYWRICDSLAKVCRSYEHACRNITWRGVQHYAPSTVSKVHGNQYVHAEVQLLVLFELSLPDPPPRAIGASKEACFLCDSLVRAHGRFRVSKAHRQTYPDWTVPDLQEYTWETIKRLRACLRQVVQDVSNEVQRARNQKASRPPPHQSSVNLRLVHYRTPSMSTVHSAARDRLSDLQSRAEPEGLASPSPARDVSGSLTTSFEGISSPNVIQAGKAVDSCERPIENGPVSGLEPLKLHHQPACIEITNSSSIFLQHDWVQLHVSMSEQPSLSTSKTPTSTPPSRFTKGSLCFLPSDGTTGTATAEAPVIDVDSPIMWRTCRVDSRRCRS